MSIAKAFPDYDAATLPPIPAAWTDMSWGNDICPSWEALTCPEWSIRVFCDYADPNERETADAKRYFAYASLLDGAAPIDLTVSDDWQDILAHVVAFTFTAHLRGALAPPEWFAMMELNGADADSGVCASHDFCDANMVMAGAFETLGIPLHDPAGEMTDEGCTIWNRAWPIAHRRWLGGGAAAGRKAIDMLAVLRREVEDWRVALCGSRPELEAICALIDAQPGVAVVKDDLTADRGDQARRWLDKRDGLSNDPLRRAAQIALSAIDETDFGQLADDTGLSVAYDALIAVLSEEQEA